MFEDVAQPGVRLLAVGLGCFDQALDLRAGRGALGRVAEQPILAVDHPDAGENIVKCLYAPVFQSSSGVSSLRRRTGKIAADGSGLRVG